MLQGRHVRTTMMVVASLLVAACSTGQSNSSESAPSTTGSPAPATTGETTEAAPDPTAASTGPERDETDEATDEVTGESSEQTQDLAWTACADVLGLECATLSVPLDHAARGSETIDLALARQPAGDPDARIGSLVFNPGGPGGSGIGFLEFARFSIPPDVADRFDIVSFDPRGVGASSAVDCDLVLDDGVTLVADDDRAGWDALVTSSQEQLATCTAQPGGLAPYIGTNNAARDLDLIRAALGDEQLTYVGFSYGTRLGATYAELFPDRVRALVLDGAVKPTTDFSELAPGQVAGFDRAFENFAAACDADPDCVLAALGPVADVTARVRADIAGAGSFPTADPDRVLTPGELDLGIVSALYSKDAWPFLAEALQLADTADDGSLFQVLTDSYFGREPDGTYANQQEANGLINCADDGARPDTDTVWKDADTVADASTYFAPVLRASTGCLGIDPAVDPLVIGPATGSAPILVIGTTGDPATPYEWAVEMAEALDSGVLYTVEGEGHTAYLSIECVTGVVDAYLIDLTVPDDGASCADDVGDDYFLPAGESDIDRIIAFFDCLVDQGLPIDPVTTADILADPSGERLFGDLDLADPDVGVALAACQALLPS